MPGYNSQRQGTARTSQISYFLLLCMFNFFIVMHVPFSAFRVLFVCKCVLYCCHRVSSQLRLNICTYIYHITFLYTLCRKHKGNIMHINRRRLTHPDKTIPGHLPNFPTELDHCSSLHKQDYKHSSFITRQRIS
jgi:hypothetical protein